MPVLLLVALAVVAAGCGGGGGGNRNDAYAGSVSDYASALNSICRPAAKRVQDLQLTSVQAIVQKGQQARDIIRETFDKIDNLKPPSEVEDAANDFISAGRDETDKFGDLIDAAKKGDAAKVTSISREIAAIDTRSDEAARRIGAKGCASQSSG
jgi:hypothetical protein